MEEDWRRERERRAIGEKDEEGGEDKREWKTMRRGGEQGKEQRRTERSGGGCDGGGGGDKPRWNSDGAKFGKRRRLCMCVLWESC